ncbi:MAG: polysaccharide biosynthesis C-terminal domain-containing protein [Spirochaetales bacterium]|nr:polysaccharide biosynthesis C-terminal domain-containing protein [Spirochaetales bacterium]
MNRINKNYIYNVLYEALTVITPLITASYLARVLGADNIGVFSFTESIVSYFELFAIMGISVYGHREISFHQDNIIERTKAFWNTKITSAAISGTVLVVYVFFAAYMNSALYWIFTMAIISTVVDVTWFFQGMEEFGRIVLRNVILKVLTIICIFCFVKTRDDFLLYAFIHVGLALLSEVMLVPQLRKYLCKVPLKDLSPFRNFKPIIMLFIPSIAVHIYYRIDKSMIGWITRDSFENGYYEQATSIVRTIIPLVTAMGTVLLPRISFCHKKKDIEGVRSYVYKNVRFLWLLTIPAAFGVAAVAGNMVPWFFGPGYEPVIPLLQVLAVMLVIHGWTDLLGYNYLIPTEQEKKYSVTVISGALINVVLNYFLIARWKAMGAAIASVISELITMVIQLFIVRKALSIRKMFLLGVKYAVAGLVMFVAVSLVAGNLDPSIINTFIIAATGVAVYVIMLLILRDSLFIDTAKGILSKFRKTKEGS